jgi:hypothetical protein
VARVLGYRLYDRRPSPSGPVRGLQCLLWIKLGQHPVDDVRAVELVAEARRGIDLGFMIEAPVDLPLDQVFAAGGGDVVAERGPGDPAFAIAVREEGEQLGAVRHPVPADCAVAVGSDGEAAVTSDADPPGSTGCGNFPQQLSCGVESTEMPFRTKHETTAVWANCETAGCFILLEFQGLARQRRMIRVLPALDIETGDLSRGKPAIGRRVPVDPALMEVELCRRLTFYIEIEPHSCPVRAHQ